MSMLRIPDLAIGEFAGRDFARRWPRRHPAAAAIRVLDFRPIANMMSLLIISVLVPFGVPNLSTAQREIAFTIMDVARLLKTLADQRARQFGMTRAQWAVLFRLDRSEGLKQSELAELLDLQPITLTRLLDRLADNGLIERRADPNDRRANRLFLTPAARPLLVRLTALGEDLMTTVLAGFDDKATGRMRRDLDLLKENLRAAINRNAAPQDAVVDEAS
jgi:MarR family transcriptional regulator for hemolysin